VALAVLVGAGFVVEAEAAPVAHLPKGAWRIDVTARPDSRAVQPGFLGLSIEFPSSIAYSGGDPARPDPVFIQLVKNLNPGQRPVIRFGGDTTDWTWWPVHGHRQPGGIRYTLSSRWLAVTRATAQALDARLILGVNFEADRRAIAGPEARALLRGIGRRYISGFELGNEPEVYGSLPWYTTKAGVPVPGRSRTYSFDSYLHDYRSVSGALPRNVTLVGPASGAQAWLSGLGTYLHEDPRAHTVTFHRYPLHRCYTARSSPAYPTIGNLLRPGASSGPATSLAPAARVAHAHGLSFRSDELNSVSCGGARGVSDTFASSLWGLDTLFHMVRSGIDGVNVHTFHSAVYAPFAVAHSSHGWSGEVKPLYYGMLMFARAAPPGSRLLALRYRARRHPAALRVWATRDRSGRVRVAMLNDSSRRAATVAVKVPGGAGTADLDRLEAPHINSRSGVTIAGQSFGGRTATGELAGSPRAAVVTRTAGRFVVRLPAASAALLTVPRR
jgi:hypothetical protein